MKRIFTLVASALITTQLACFDLALNAKALNDVSSNDYESIDAECVGDPGYGISNIPLEQQLEDLLSNPNLTAAQREAATKKVEQAIAFRDAAAVDSANNAVLRQSYPTVTLSVPAYTQETNYYCGPATTRQTLGYLGMIVPGSYSPPSQSTIAAAIHTTTNGTEWYNITAYINTFSFMGIPNNYIEYVPSSKSDMETVIYSALTQTNPTPPILQVKTNGYSSVMGYSTLGHYMNVSGMKTENGVNYYQITDPYRGRLSPAQSAKYDMTTDDVWTITQNHWAKHFLY